MNKRIKQINNRGGDKISPREVGDVSMDHSSIRQIVTFAVPHDLPGEEAAVAIVLSGDADADKRNIRRFAQERLAEFKVPRAIVFVDETSESPTGKL